LTRLPAVFLHLGIKHGCWYFCHPFRHIAMRLEQRLRQEARADFETATAQAANWQQAEHAAQALEGRLQALWPLDGDADDAHAHP
jgi:hypothetical protein